MRDKRAVVLEDLVEEPRLEELSDEDLEAVAGGCYKPGNSSYGLATAFFSSGGPSLHNEAGCH
jgi:hypothetical protein